MKNKLVILFWLLLIHAAPASASIIPIIDGGTNSGTALNNNKIIWASSGKIVENQDLSSTGPNLTIGQTGVSTSKTTPSKFILQGSASSQANGPNMQAYTSADNYPLIQVLNNAHDDAAFSFDAYYDGGASQWKSSSSNSNFRLYKNGNVLTLGYASGISQGSQITSFSSALSIDDTGNVTFGGPIYLPTSSSGATAAALDYYEEYTWNTTTQSGGGDGVSSVAVAVSITRVGKVVTVTLPATTATVSSGVNGGDFISLGSIPSRFVPVGTSGFPIRVVDIHGYAPGYINVSSSGSVVVSDHGSFFPPGSGDGWWEAVTFSYLVE